ncbi:AraC-like DNA-binding protein [Pedobacter africanus]|uniref:AraC-like DNA-binding protein n=1 Tax=Pedobacter africanus TaxID=151894 RepID=A0ACC6L446_9SPHI|nr:helix-turn-helix domain-containing protein [Pedobacter africanus]MDR6786063.1 AraC-like DNA-binding protein [Pedobacter africanus]
MRQSEQFNSETSTQISLLEVHRTPALLMQKLDNLIEQHFMEQRSAEFYSSALAYITRTLNEITHCERGKTTFMMIQDRIFKEAQSLLETTPMSIKAMSFILGFEDPSYFGKFFKKMSGKPPKAYRLQALKMAEPPLTPPLKGGETRDQSPFELRGIPTGGGDINLMQ